MKNTRTQKSCRLAKVTQFHYRWNWHHHATTISFLSFSGTEGGDQFDLSSLDVRTMLLFLKEYFKLFNSDLPLRLFFLPLPTNCDLLSIKSLYLPLTHLAWCGNCLHLCFAVLELEDGGSFLFCFTVGATPGCAQSFLLLESSGNNMQC